MVKLRFLSWVLLSFLVFGTSVLAQDLKFVYTLPENDFSKAYLGFNDGGISFDALSFNDTAQNRYLQANKLNLISQNRLLFSVDYKTEAGNRVQGIGLMSLSTAHSQMLISTNKSDSYLQDFIVLQEDSILFLINEDNQSVFGRINLLGKIDTLFQCINHRAVSNLYFNNINKNTYFLTDSSGSIYLMEYNWKVGNVSKAPILAAPFGISNYDIYDSDSNNLFLSLGSTDLTKSGLYSLSIDSNAVKFENLVMYTDILEQNELGISRIYQNSRDTLYLLSNNIASKSSFLYNLSGSGIIRAKFKVPYFYFFENNQSAVLSKNAIILNLSTDTLHYSGGLLKFNMLTDSFEYVYGFNDSIGRIGSCLSNIYNESGNEIISLTTLSGRTSDKGCIAIYNFKSDTIVPILDFLGNSLHWGHQFTEANFITLNQKPVYLSRLGGNQRKGSLHEVDVLSNQAKIIYNFGSGKASAFDSLPKYPRPNSLRNLNDSLLLFVSESDSYQSSSLAVTKLNLKNKSFKNLYITPSKSHYIEDISNVSDDKVLVELIDFPDFNNHLLILDIRKEEIQDTLVFDLSNLGNVKKLSNVVLFNDHVYALYLQAMGERIFLAKLGVQSNSTSIFYIDRRYLGNINEYKNLSVSGGELYFSNVTDDFDGNGSIVSFNIATNEFQYYRLKYDINSGAMPFGRLFFSGFSNEIYFLCGLGFQNNTGGLMKFSLDSKEFSPVISFNEANDYNVDLWLSASRYQGGIWLSKMWPTAINEKHKLVKDGISIQCFPNPAKQNITIRIINSTSEDMSSYSVYDMSGKKLINQTIEIGVSEANLDVSKLPKGVYLLKLLTDKETTLITRFVKN